MRAIFAAIGGTRPHVSIPLDGSGLLQQASYGFRLRRLRALYRASEARQIKSSPT